MGGDAAGLIHPCDRGLRFQVEVLLASNGQFSVDAQCAGVDRGNITARQTESVRKETAGVDGLLDRQDRGQRLIFDVNPRGAPLRGLERFAEDPRDRLPVEHHLAWEEWL